VEESHKQFSVVLVLTGIISQAFEVCIIWRWFHWLFRSGAPL